MDDLKAYVLENRYPEVRAIEGGARGLKYLVDDDNRGIIISGMRGMTGLDIRQAKALARELPEILEGMGFDL